MFHIFSLFSYCDDSLNGAAYIAKDILLNKNLDNNLLNRLKFIIICFKYKFSNIISFQINYIKYLYMDFKLISKNNVGSVVLLLLVIAASQAKVFNFLIEIFIFRFE